MKYLQYTMNPQCLQCLPKVFLLVLCFEISIITHLTKNFDKYYLPGGINVTLIIFEKRFLLMSPYCRRYFCLLQA